MYTKQWVIKGRQAKFFHLKPSAASDCHPTKVMEGNKKGR